MVLYFRDFHRNRSPPMLTSYCFLSKKWGVYVQFGSILDCAGGSKLCIHLLFTSFPFHPNSFSPVSVILHASSIHPNLLLSRHYSQYNRLQHMQTPASLGGMLKAVSFWPVFRAPMDILDSVSSKGTNLPLSVCFGDYKLGLYVEVCVVLLVDRRPYEVQ
jgi:hypothetical protein